MGIHYCANCFNAKVFRQVQEDKRLYKLRVKCLKGKWKNCKDEEKVYKYSQIANKIIYDDLCYDYESMGEEDKENYLDDLKKQLPKKDDFFSFEYGRLI